MVFSNGSEPGEPLCLSPNEEPLFTDNSFGYSQNTGLVLKHVTCLELYF